MLLVYAVMIVTAIYGAMKVQVDFKVDYFIAEGSLIYNYFQLNNEYFQSGFQATIYVDSPDVDYASEEI